MGIEDGVFRPGMDDNEHETELGQVQSGKGAHDSESPACPQAAGVAGLHHPSRTLPSEVAHTRQGVHRAHGSPHAGMARCTQAAERSPA